MSSIFAEASIYTAPLAIQWASQSEVDRARRIAQRFAELIQTEPSERPASFTDDITDCWREILQFREVLDESLKTFTDRYRRLDNHENVFLRLDRNPATLATKGEVVREYLWAIPPSLRPKTQYLRRLDNQAGCNAWFALWHQAFPLLPLKHRSNSPPSLVA